MLHLDVDVTLPITFAYPPPNYRPASGVPTDSDPPSKTLLILAPLPPPHKIYIPSTGLSSFPTHLTNDSEYRRLEPFSFAV